MGDAARMEDWKGESLIRGAAADKAKSKSEVRRLVSRIAHENRKATGAPCPAAKSHSAFVRAAVYRTDKVKKDA